MKYYFTSILIFLFLTPCFSQSNDDSFILKNKVKEVRIYDSKNKLVSLTKYNSKGLLEFTCNDNFGGSTFLKTSLTKVYDEKGVLIKTIHNHSSFKEPTIWLYKYDSTGNLVAILNDKNKFVFKFYYSNKNFKTKDELYNEDKITETKTYEYLEDSSIIIQNINGDFIKNRKNITYLDKNKNEIKNESFNNDELAFQILSEYKNNRIIKKTFKENLPSEETYTYDRKNNLINRQIFKIADGKETKTTSENYKYFKNGLIKTYTEKIYLPTNITKYKYEYTFY